jgi:patatin-like phospholipase/acyl hydrolase
MSKSTYILSIDGGGVRGVIPVRILQNIENDPEINKTKSKTFIYDKFNVFAGSSAGSMTVGAMAYNKVSANEIAENYINDKNVLKFMPTNYDYIGILFLAVIILVVFISLGYYMLPLIICEKKFVSFLGASVGLLVSIILIFVLSILILYNTPRYPGKPKSELISKYSKKNTKLSDTEKDVFITSYNMTKQEPYFFRSWETNKNFILSEVIDAATAAPGLFPAVKINDEFYIDGGVITNNPTECIYSEILKKENGNPNKIKILSIGCGKLKKFEVNHSITKWGQLKWVTSGNIGLFIGNEEIVNLQVKSFSESLKDKYLRIDGELEKISITDTRPEYLQYLRDESDKWYNLNRDSLIEFFND